MRQELSDKIAANMLNRQTPPMSKRPSDMSGKMKKETEDQGLVLDPLSTL